MTTEKNEVDRETPSCLKPHKPKVQKDWNRSQPQMNVLRAYGIIPAQGCNISSCFERTVDLPTDLSTVPSNVQGTIACFLG